MAVSPAGDVLVGETRQEQEDPARFHVTLRVRRHDGRLLAVSGRWEGRELLAAAPQARGGGFTVLMGGARRGRFCCTFGEAVDVSAQGVAGRPRRLVSFLGGGAVGRLIALPGRLLAVLAGSSGVWVSEAGRRGFGGVRRLSATGVQPESVAAGAGPGGSSEVVWTEADPQRGGNGAGTIFVAGGGAASAPAAAHPLRRLPPGHAAEELALPAAATAPGLAWVESSYNPDGSVNSSLEVMALHGARRPLSLTVPRSILSAPSLAADRRGDEFLAFRACTRFGSCEVVFSSQRAGGRLGTLHRAGAIDAGESPALEALPRGGAELAWVSRGTVRLATLGPAGRAARGGSLPGGGQDSAPALAALPDGDAFGVFVRGLRAPALWGASLTP